MDEIHNGGNTPLGWVIQCPVCFEWHYRPEGSPSCTVRHFSTGSCCHYGETLVNPPTPPEEEKAVDLSSTTDAQVWAQEWCRIAREIEADGREVIDEGWMIGWFANAMAAQEMSQAPAE